MLDYEQALPQLLASLETTKKKELVNLIEANNRVLSEDISAQYDHPLFSNSAMDGYAVCDPQANLTQFTVVGRIVAGDQATQTLNTGEACRIFTGAALPRGTTTVIMQEHVEVNDSFIVLKQAYPAQRNMRLQAEEIKVGDILFHKGHTLNPASIALCASQGFAKLPVLKRLKVCVFSTGNELLEPQEILSPRKIYDANRYQLLTWLTSLTVEIYDGGILPDDLISTQKTLEQASLSQDVIIFSGGASVGEEDHIKQAIKHIGSLNGWKLAIKPGKPFGFGKANDAEIFMLPGNPVATFVTFFILVYPALLKLQGKAPEIKTTVAIADFSQDKLEERREFLRASMRTENNQHHVTIAKQQASNMLGALSLANSLIEIPPNTIIKKGDLVKVYPFPC